MMLQWNYQLANLSARLRAKARINQHQQRAQDVEDINYLSVKTLLPHQAVYTRQISTVLRPLACDFSHI
jgi:hypothetical protein